MENVILLALLTLILGGAAGYIYKAKKSGKNTTKKTKKQTFKMTLF